MCEISYRLFHLGVEEGDAVKVETTGESKRSLPSKREREREKREVLGLKGDPSPPPPTPKRKGNILMRSDDVTHARTHISKERG